jgi:hypothetical protein
VELVEVDVVDLQPSQAGFAGLDQVLAREAGVVRPRVGGIHIKNVSVPSASRDTRSPEWPSWQ